MALNLGIIYQVLWLIELINIFLLSYNILIMSNTIKEGEFYINQRKNQEKCLSKDLDIIEGFTVVSRQAQKKNPSNFYIPDGSDPGQTVMCEPDKIKYIRISQTDNYLHFQEIQVFDENGINVALSIEKEVTKPVATMSSYYNGTNANIAINGITNDNQSWPNSVHTAVKGGWWEVNLGRPVNVKKVVVYNRPDCCQDRLSGAQLLLIDREHRTVMIKTLTSARKQVFNIENNKKVCGGPVIQKNMDNFEELKELRNTYNKQLQNYNQSIKNLLEDSKKMGNISNKFVIDNKTREEYSKLKLFLNKIKEKIRELVGEDIKLNNRLMEEQKIMENRLKRYEQVYSQIGREKRLINRDSAMEEDATLNMLSSNKMYIIWSILALGLTFGVTKFTK